MRVTTVRPGAPGTYDQHTRWALAAFTYRRKKGRWGQPVPDRTPGVLGTRYGRTVVLATPRLPYGRSTHTTAQLVHIAYELLIAFTNGRMVDSQVTWMCGSTTVHFQLTAEIPGPLCLMCHARLQQRTSA